MTMVRLASKKRFFVIFGRTDLRISLSGAKFDEEADFDVRSAVGPPKPHQIDEKLIFRSENFAKKMFSAIFFDRKFGFSSIWCEF